MDKGALTGIRGVADSRLKKRVVLRPLLVSFFALKNNGPPVPKRQEGRSVMLTLREVRELLDTDNNTQRVLSKKELDQKDEEIVAKKTVGEDTEIIVYKNGAVFYRSGKRSTVFSSRKRKAIHTVSFQAAARSMRRSLKMRNGVSGWSGKGRTGLWKTRDVWIVFTQFVLIR